MDAAQTTEFDMKRLPLLPVLLALGLGLLLANVARADGRAGSIEFSDGHKLTGAISLTAGKDLKIFVDSAQVAIALDEVKEIHFVPEKEEMWEGFYFPNAGQTTQVKTGEVYPIRYIKTQITLANGKVVEGHLYTTVFYCEGDDSTDKVVVMSKQSGPNKTKLSDLVYPTVIHFDVAAADAGFAQIDLTKVPLQNAKPPVFLSKPELALLNAQQTEGKPIWTIPINDSGRILFSVQADDGVHVAWPDSPPDPDMKQAADTGIKNMQDFYDGRTVLGYITDTDAGDIYTLAMLKRIAAAVNGDGSAFTDGTAYSLVILRWKYDPDQKKATLMNRAMLAIGRQNASNALPNVIKQPELLSDISGNKQN
jgi:hypothetical protein